ncbi:response regulator transcription factor [Sulfuriflexus sp.]|uniref:response regulator transcription factor n=1 Tax=Sulfuriflexus sp. TaxID=2015443 RepID=UPI0028CC0629|nr:response regulator transcription factor [Sulfuriflexus sp.]MDT8403775.1 response regulator transcription factor [Sulfuriflexus sp.]
MRIALLEDDEHIANLISLWIEEEGHHCTIFPDGRKMLNALKAGSFDLLLLDWMVPEIDGEGVLLWVRENLNWRIPIVFLTMRDNEEDIVKILGLGADDYITKPIRQKEMLARITALARRANVLDTEKSASAELKYGPYTIHLKTNTVSRNDDAIKLTKKEFELVLFLFRNLGRIVSRGHMLESVWGHSQDINTRTADTHISRIRNKLGLLPENGWRISAIYHHGYRLEQIDGDEAVTH